MPNVCAKQAVYTRSRIRSSSDVDHDEGEGIKWSMLAVLAKNVTASRAQSCAGCTAPEVAVSGAPWERI